MTTTLPREDTAVDQAYDIALESLLDEDVECERHPSVPAVAALDHTGCPDPPLLACEPCRARLARAVANREPLACSCGARDIPHRDITIRPI